ncbi:MAG: polysaccharide biosynthesis C-terminal domain-containing protein, partial [Oscillospiraceae bacterium]
VALGNYVRSALVSIENVLIPAGLKKHGSSKGAALASYGMIKGMVMPILTFPSAILGAFSSLLIPEVSENNAVNNRSKIEYIIDKSLGATLIFSVIVTVVFFCYSKEIGNIFYKSEQCGNLMLILTPLIPLLYLDSIVDSLLKGLNQQLSAMKYNTADSVIRVILIYFLVPNLGVWGYIAVLFVGTIFNFSMSLNRLIKVSQVKIKWDKWVIKPLIGAGVAVLITKTVFLIFKDFGMGMTVVTFIKIGIILVFYYIFLRMLGVITKKEVLWIKYALQGIKG